MNVLLGRGGRNADAVKKNQNGGSGWEAWVGTSGLHAWGVREFYYGPNVRALSQYYGASESVRTAASRQRNAIVNRARAMTPEPYRSMAGQMKSNLKVNPNGSFAKPNAGVMWKMRGVGAGSGILLGYGVYQSATNISNAAAHGYGTQAAINEGVSWAGAIAGGYAGAKGGAVVGSFFGPVGTVIGGFVGGIGGSFIGGTAGYWTGSQFTGY